MTDPGDIGPAGSVRLRAYLLMVYSLWFSAGCEGEAGYGHSTPTGIRAAIRLMGSSEATLRQLERRLRCSRCGNRQVGVTVYPVTRPHKTQERDGPRPETLAELPE
jgi:hypothetical protein